MLTLGAAMERYRWLTFFVDATRNPLRILPDKARDQERRRAEARLAEKYGRAGREGKFDRWFGLEPPPVCLPGEYHDLLQEVEGSYIAGQSYPALTGACCLGERILNDLVIGLKNQYQNSRYYKEVARKHSLVNWGRAISILLDWRVINDETAREFRGLLKFRAPGAVHYGDVGERAQQSKLAIDHLYAAVRRIFGLEAEHFFMCEGEVYVKKAFETQPFVQKFVIPSCLRVSYAHRIESRGGENVLVNTSVGANREMTDEEFCAERRRVRGGGAP